jgi:hypothetical protein
MTKIQQSRLLRNLYLTKMDKRNGEMDSPKGEQNIIGF